MEYQTNRDGWVLVGTYVAAVVWGVGIGVGGWVRGLNGRGRRSL